LDIFNPTYKIYQPISFKNLQKPLFFNWWIFQSRMQGLERAQTGLSHQLLFSSVSVTPTASVKGKAVFLLMVDPYRGSYISNLELKA